MEDDTCDDKLQEPRVQKWLFLFNASYSQEIEKIPQT